MKLTVVHYFSDNTFTHLASEYFIDGEMVSLSDYANFMKDLYDETTCETDESDSQCACSLDGNCEKCDCSECDGCDNIECCNENIEYMDCEDKELENECECPICTGKEEAMGLCCYCEECLENYMKESIEECLEVIFEDSCPECKIDSVLKLAYKCLELGKQSTRQDVMEFLEK